MTHPLEAAAAQIAALVRPRSAEIEAARRLPADVAAAMAKAGLHRALLPPALHGGSAAPADLLRAIETIATADAATGWCLMIGATTAMSAARLDEPVAQALFGDPLAIAAGVFAPMGRAVPRPTAEGGGWNVTGRWAWGSGAQTARWIFAGCLVLDGPDGGPRLLPNGQPDVTMMVLPADAVVFHDTWFASGLCGTGSLDFEARGIHVPDGHSLSLLSSPPRLAGPGLAFPVFGLLSLGIAAVSLGIAARALEELVELAGAKTPAGSRRKLAERAMVQAEFAQAEAAVLAARGYLYAVTEAATAALAGGSGSVLPLADRIALRRAATHAVTACADAVARLYRLGGGSAVYAASPLQRCLRDVMVTTQHMMTGPATWELIGRAGLGLPVDDTQV